MFLFFAVVVSPLPTIKQREKKERIFLYITKTYLTAVFIIINKIV